ncbi:MAG: hypothetical protein NTU76_03700 [Candidatus Taylorbacteria bacterium]|nr:hypothetical protein [Candidatus Taylorbacteria bacterium]
MKTEDKIRIVIEIVLSNVLYIGTILLLIVLIYVSIQAVKISKIWQEENNKAMGVIR